MFIDDVAREMVYHVWNILREFLGHNFLPSLRTLKHNYLKTFKTKSLKKNKIRLKPFHKNLGFSIALVHMCFIHSSLCTMFLHIFLQFYLLPFSWVIDYVWLRPMTHAPETGYGNRQQDPYALNTCEHMASNFWRRFVKSVSGACVVDLMCALIRCWVSDEWVS